MSFAHMQDAKTHLAFGAASRPRSQPTAAVGAKSRIATSKADANKGRSIPGTEWNNERDPATVSHAVKEYLATLDDAAFAPHIPVIDKSAPEDGSFSRADFRYDEEEDVYI